IFKFRGIVSAAKVHACTMRAPQFAQAPLIFQPGRAVMLEHPLIEPQSGWAARPLDIHFSGMEISVTGQQQPAVGALHRHARMAESVARQRNQRDVWRQAFERAHALKSEPALALPGQIASPPGAAGPLLRSETLAVHPRRLP